MDHTLYWSGMTHPGRFRKTNEDGFLGMILYPREAHYLGKEGHHGSAGLEFVFAVSDGMGGANAGEFASKIALETVSRKMAYARPPDLVAATDRIEYLKTLVLGIHDSIQNIGRHYEECRGMGATLSLVWLAHSTISFVHIGDSRIYHIPNHAPITQISEDHSQVGRLHREGKLNERQSKNHPERHILDQALGGNIRKLEPQVGSFEIGSDDYIVLCSDGICDGLYNRSIENTIVHPPFNLKDYRPSERLIREAMFSSGRDNLTAMVIQFRQNPEMGSPVQPE
jgi:serine/threonine protein phosphatase PrpC